MEEEDGRLICLKSRGIWVAKTLFVLEDLKWSLVLFQMALLCSGFHSGIWPNELLVQKEQLETYYNQIVPGRNDFNCLLQKPYVFLS